MSLETFQVTSKAQLLAVLTAMQSHGCVFTLLLLPPLGYLLVLRLILVLTCKHQMHIHLYTFSSLLDWEDKQLFWV